MTTTPTVPPPADAAASPGPRALESARAHLQRELDPRYVQFPACAADAGPQPLVVPLGAADVLGDAAGDPYAAVRPHATVHLTARAVLIGPWGGEAEAPGCGRCLGMRWQRLRSRSEREALEGRQPLQGAEDWPLLTPFAVDAVRAAWSSAFGPVHESDPAPAGPVAALRPPRAVPASPGAEGLPRVTRVDLATLALATFPMLPEPLCPHCVQRVPDTPEAGRIPLGPAPKPDPDGYRVRPLESFPLPGDALANPVCGALGSGTWINPASTTTAPVAGSVFVRGYAGLNDVTFSGQASRYTTSRLLTYLEGLERYAGTHRRRPEQPVVASLDALRSAGEPVLDPAACGFYAPETYATDPMVSPFDPARAIPWLWGHSLRDDRPILVPARLVHYSAGVAADNFVFECSNGCATGGSPVEAMLFALLELIERDAFLLAWHTRTPLTEIDLGSCTGRTVRSLLDRAGMHGYDVRAYDTRMDLPVPVVTGLAVRRDGGPGTLSFGAAAGFDPEDAVESALSEVLTYIPHLPYQVTERQAELEAMAADFGRVLHLKDHAQLHGLPGMAHHSREFLEPAGRGGIPELFADWHRERPRTGDLVDDLRLLVDALADAGHDVIAVDQTAPEQRRMGLHTVCATVPGLLPLDFGWNRQRVLRTPRLLTGLRQAGRRADDLPAADVKRVPHPFP
ncbi:TOMM precursor leader peptide-binding protein [Streptomyces sp. DSM 42041]|uniref:TOMM leader peptide-binding protein n=1 Tax=Streptomyces hazeniae TaxID=3075538 RepID=A0ABU2NRR7_9ACTN|nr:TOMM precursor leader peptide-binding protein [Streptomyces sp. DSM 42041]MDT0379677.1 TOMM precursor leader peptide-binding protein [Streptomyces sp. DSM 42041]